VKLSASRLTGLTRITKHFYEKELFFLNSTMQSIYEEPYEFNFVTFFRFFVESNIISFTELSLMMNYDLKDRLNCLN